MGWAGAENIDWPASERAKALDPPNLGDTSVRIVTASYGQSNVKVQSFWLRLSSNATQVKLQGSHDVYLDDPDGVAEVILSVL
jgi:hypothetical protein